MKKNIIYIVLLLLLTSCGGKQVVITHMQGERILVTPTNHPDLKLLETVYDYKVKLDKEMNVIIGQSDQQMPFGAPESLLTNLTSDVMMKVNPSDFKGDKPDLSVMNVNGHRAPLPQGNITVGDIYETYSFDNELAMVKVKGSDLNDLFSSYARMGGSGISSNVKLIITKDGKLVSAKINGQPVDPNKTYNIVTLDYLAEGNDGMEAFKKALSVYKPGIILRDYMMDYVKKQTIEGKSISSKLDGRIIIQ